MLGKRVSSCSGLDEEGGHLVKPGSFQKNARMGVHPIGATARSIEPPNFMTKIRVSKIQFKAFGDRSQDRVLTCSFTK